MSGQQNKGAKAEVICAGAVESEDGGTRPSFAANEDSERTWTAGMAKAPGRLLHLLHHKGREAPEDSAKGSVAASSDPLQDKGSPHGRCGSASLAAGGLGCRRRSAWLATC